MGGLTGHGMSSGHVFYFFGILAVTLTVDLVIKVSLFRRNDGVDRRGVLGRVRRTAVKKLATRRVRILGGRPSLRSVMPCGRDSDFLVSKVGFRTICGPANFKVVGSCRLIDKAYPRRCGRVMVSGGIRLRLKCRLGVKSAVALPATKDGARSFVVANFASGIRAKAFCFCISPTCTRRNILLSSVPCDTLVHMGNTARVKLVSFRGAMCHLTLSRSVDEGRLCFGDGFYSSLVDKSKVKNILLTALFVTFSDKVIVCDIFCLSMSGRMSRVKRLGAVNVARGRVGQVVHGRKCHFYLFKVPTNVAMNVVFTCLLRPGKVAVVGTVTADVLTVVLNVVVMRVSMCGPTRVTSGVSPVRTAGCIKGSPRLGRDEIRGEGGRVQLSPCSLTMLDRGRGQGGRGLAVTSLTVNKVLFVIKTAFVSS